MTLSHDLNRPTSRHDCSLHCCDHAADADGQPTPGMKKACRQASLRLLPSPRVFWKENDALFLNWQGKGGGLGINGKAAESSCKVEGPALPGPDNRTKSLCLQPAACPRASLAIWHQSSSVAEVYTSCTSSRSSSASSSFCMRMASSPASSVSFCGFMVTSPISALKPLSSSACFTSLNS